jgi:hypothetical protein
VAIAIGTRAPEVEGVDIDGPRALVFFKVTCGTTKLATPAVERLARAYPGRVVGVGQDARPELDGFAREFGLTLPLVPDLAPYTASDAYGIVSAPTVVAVDAAGLVADVAESWDRDGWNRVSATLARLLGVPAVTASEPGDGLPSFKPG